MGWAGKGLVQTSSPFPQHRLARLVEYLHRETKAAPLALAAIDGAQRVADDEAGADVGAARDGAELHILLLSADKRSQTSGDKSTDPVLQISRKAGRSWVLMGA